MSDAQFPFVLQLMQLRARGRYVDGSHTGHVSDRCVVVLDYVSSVWSWRLWRHLACLSDLFVSIATRPTAPILTRPTTPILKHVGQRGWAESQQVYL